MSQAPSHDLLEQRIARVITHQRLIVDKMTVVVGVSAGPDSLALLLLLKSLPLKLKLIAVYVDHQLRPAETGEEYATIAEIGKNLNIRTVREIVDVPAFRAQKGGSIEEIARFLRYEALQRIRIKEKADRIAVGHTADDQVEEFFLRLLRGSGAKGLSGMQLQNGNLIRPLLHERKEVLLRYLREKNVRHHVDSSNLDCHLLRNRIRLELLPMLEQRFNPSLRTTVLQNMDILRQEDEYLDGVCQELYSTHITEKHDKSVDRTLNLSTSIDQFRQLPEPLRRRLIEKCCWRFNSKPDFAKITELSDFACHGRNGKELHLANGLRAVIRNDRLVLLRPLPAGRLRGGVPCVDDIDLEIPAPGTYHIKGHNRILRLAEIAWPRAELQNVGQVVDRDLVAFPLRLRSAMPGEKISPAGHSGSRKVSRYFNDRKIPRQTRPGWPLLLAANTIIALPGLAVDKHYLCSPATSRALLIEWLERNEDQE